MITWVEWVIITHLEYYFALFALAAWLVKGWVLAVWLARLAQYATRRRAIPMHTRIGEAALGIRAIANTSFAIMSTYVPLGLTTRDYTWIIGDAVISILVIILGRLCRDKELSLGNIGDLIFIVELMAWAACGICTSIAAAIGLLT